MSTLKFNQWLNTDNTENYKCRAWVNFNGTGAVAIRASGNVSSITDLGVGLYQANFTTAIADTNYGVTLGSQRPSATAHMDYINRFVGSVTIRCIDDTGAGVAQDCADVSAIVVR